VDFRDSSGSDDGVSPCLDLPIARIFDLFRVSGGRSLDSSSRVGAVVIIAGAIRQKVSYMRNISKNVICYHTRRYRRNWGNVMMRFCGCCKLGI
jgi:hypothetical protein